MKTLSSCSLTADGLHSSKRPMNGPKPNHTAISKQQSCDHVQPLHFNCIIFLRPQLWQSFPEIFSKRQLWQMLLVWFKSFSDKTAPFLYLRTRKQKAWKEEFWCLKRLRQGTFHIMCSSSLHILIFANSCSQNLKRYKMQNTNEVHLKGVCWELEECAVVQVFGSCAHCGHSIYNPQESGLGPSWVGAADAAGCHSKVQMGNNTGQRLHSRTWGSRLWGRTAKSLRTRGAGPPDCEAGMEVLTCGGSLCGPPHEEAVAQGYGENSCCGTPQAPGRVPRGKQRAPCLAVAPQCVLE